MTPVTVPRSVLLAAAKKTAEALRLCEVVKLQLRQAKTGEMGSAELELHVDTLRHCYFAFSEACQDLSQELYTKKRLQHELNGAVAATPKGGAPC